MTRKTLEKKMFNEFQLLYLNMSSLRFVFACRQQSRQCYIALKVYLHRRFHTDCECFNGLFWSLFIVRNSTTPVNIKENVYHVKSEEI